MNLNTVMYKHVWKVINFSKLDAESYYSTPFMAGDKKYRTQKLRYLQSLFYALWIKSIANIVGSLKDNYWSDTHSGIGVSLN